MKKYKKNATKLLQIRLSEDEIEIVNKTINKYGETKRMWLLSVCNLLEQYGTMRDGTFWSSDQNYAYANYERYNTPIYEDSRCELCNGKRTEYVASMVRHHHYGYKGDNAFRVQVVCNKCHGHLKGKLWVDKPWKYVVENWPHKSTETHRWDGVEYPKTNY